MMMLGLLTTSDLDDVGSFSYFRLWWWMYTKLVNILTFVCSRHLPLWFLWLFSLTAEVNSGSMPKYSPPVDLKTLRKTYDVRTQPEGKFKWLEDFLTNCIISKWNCSKWIQLNYRANCNWTKVDVFLLLDQGGRVPASGRRWTCSTFWTELDMSLLLDQGGPCLINANVLKKI